MKIAVGREPAVKINAAKPPRKSWLAAIFMTIGLPIHTVNTREQHEAPHEVQEAQLLLGDRATRKHAKDS